MKTKVQVLQNAVDICVAQELKLIKRLAGKNSELREKELKKLGTWLQLRGTSSNPLPDEDIMHMWKTFFASMWMCDRPLTQEELAEGLASLLHSFDKKYVAIRFYGAFLKTLGTEWICIEKTNRIEKFTMLVRRVTRQIFVWLHNNEWDETLTKRLNDKVARCILGKSKSIGFIIHFAEIFPDELTKVSTGNICRSKITLLLRPFAECVATIRDPKIVAHITKYISDVSLTSDGAPDVVNPVMSCDLQNIAQRTKHHTSDVTLNVTVREIPCMKKLVEHNNEPCTNVESLKTLRKTIDRTFATDKAQETDDTEVELRQTSRCIRQWNKKRRTNELSDAVVTSSPKKIKLNKIDAHITKSTFDESLDVPVPDMPCVPEDIVKKSEEHSSRPRKKVKSLRMLRRIIDRAIPTDIKMRKLKQKKRTKVLSGAEVTSTSKKIELNKVDEAQLKTSHIMNKNTKPMEVDRWDDSYQWVDSEVCVETDQTPGEIPVDVSGSCPDQSISGSTGPDMDNVINSTTDQFSDDEFDYLLLEEEEENYFDYINDRKQQNFEANRQRIDDANRRLSSWDDRPSERELNESRNGEKRVKIMLRLNRSQDVEEYIQQLRSSPKIPFDSAKKPDKGLLKRTSLVASHISRECKRIWKKHLAFSKDSDDLSGLCNVVN